MSDVIVYETHSRRLPSLRRYFGELWRRRRFAWLLARAELKAKHFETVFGQVWTVLNPLLLAGVYFFVFGVMLGTSKGDLDYLTFLLAGLFAFYYTRNSISYGAKSVVGGGSLVLNSAFPRALLPASSVMSALLSYIPMLGVYALMHLVAGRPWAAPLLLVPPLIVLQTLFNFGLALFFAAATVYFRDTSNLVPYMLRVWLYLCPVIYSIDQIPPAAARALMINPLFSLLASWQEIMEGVWPSRGLLISAFLWSAISLLGGLWFFLTREHEFAIRI